MSSPSISSFVSVVGLLAALLLLLLLPEQKLGVVFLEQGKASQALAYLDKALEFNPEHEQALLNSAILLQELGRADLRKIARERLLKLLSIDGKFAHKFPTPPHRLQRVLMMTTASSGAVAAPSWSTSLGSPSSHHTQGE